MVGSKSKRLSTRKTSNYFSLPSLPSNVDTGVTNQRGKKKRRKRQSAQATVPTVPSDSQNHCNTSGSRRTISDDLLLEESESSPHLTTLKTFTTSKRSSERLRDEIRVHGCNAGDESPHESEARKSNTEKDQQHNTMFAAREDDIEYGSREPCPVNIAGVDLTQNDAKALEIGAYGTTMLTPKITQLLKLVQESPTDIAHISSIDPPSRQHKQDDELENTYSSPASSSAAHDHTDTTSVVQSFAASPKNLLRRTTSGTKSIRRKTTASISPFFDILSVEKTSCLSFPTLHSAHFGLVQERLSDRPFHLLVVSSSFTKQKAPFLSRSVRSYLSSTRHRKISQQRISTTLYL